MNEGNTTVVVQRYLDELAGDTPSESAVRALLDQAVRRLHQLCAAMLYRSYPRLTQPPLNLQAEEMLSAVVERLLKALREVRPRTVREFFALASQHMRWELNEMARRLDEQPARVELCEGLAAAPASSDTGLTPDSRRMFAAIASLPEAEREAFDLVRIQGLTQAEAGQVLGVSAATVNRRLNRGLQLLAEALSDLRPERSWAGAGLSPARGGKGAGGTPWCPEGRTMTDNPRLQQLLDELLDSPATPEEVCASCPELLPEVRRRWEQIRRVQADIDAIFPPSSDQGTSLPALPPAGAALPEIPGYEVEGVLGHGGVGVVYRAFHLRLHRPVALKMLLAGAHALPTQRERFEREAEAVAALRHPNIVPIYDVGDLKGQPYFTMELVEGGSLAEKIHGVPQPARQAAALAVLLAEAIHEAHRCGIVHSDLKPGNVLLTTDGTPKVTDFGLAWRLEGGPELDAQWRADWYSQLHVPLPGTG